MDNDETENPALESDLRRYYQRRFEPLQHNAVLWSRVGEQIGPPRPIAPPAPKPRLQKLLPLAGTLALVLLVTWVAVSSGLLPLALLGKNAPLADALDGAVIIRGGDKPGLYVYGSDGWSYVEGSDKDSRLRARCSDGDLLIDVPNSGAKVHFVRDNALESYSDDRKDQAAALSLRRLVRTTPEGAHRTDLAFNPGEWPVYQCAKEGVMASATANRMDGPYEISRAQPTDFFAAYQPANSDSLIVPALGTRTYILTMSPHGRLLLAETSGTGLNWRMRLYVADPDGSNRVFLQERSDVPWLAAAHFSPDALYAIVTVYALGVFGEPVPYHILLLNTQANTQPALLAEYGFSLEGSNNMDTVLGMFVQNGPRAGQLVVHEAHSGGQSLRVYDPATPDKPLVEMVSSLTCAQEAFLATDRESSALAFGCANQVDTSFLFYTGADGSQQFTHPDLDSRVFWSGAAIRNGYLITMIGPHTYSPNTTPKTALLLMPLDQLATTESWGNVARLAPVGDSIRSLFLGSKRMAYVANGELYVSNYDGSGEIMVESQVEGISAAWEDIAP